MCTRGGITVVWALATYAIFRLCMTLKDDQRDEHPMGLLACSNKLGLARMLVRYSLCPGLGRRSATDVLLNIHIAMSVTLRRPWKSKDTTFIQVAQAKQQNSTAQLNFSA